VKIEIRMMFLRPDDERELILAQNLVPVARQDAGRRLQQGIHLGGVVTRAVAVILTLRVTS